MGKKYPLHLEYEVSNIPIIRKKNLPQEVTVKYTNYDDRFFTLLEFS